MAWTRESWNEIIRQVNEVLQNPPEDTDCEALPTIDEVGPAHIWTKGDIRNVQDALMATCEDISFDPVPDLWQQSIIDEINDATGQAWCNCEPDDDDDDDDEPCDPQAGKAEDGTEITVLTLEPEISSYCPGYTNPDATINLCDYLNGMQIGASGYTTRSYQLFRKIGGSYSGIGGGFVNEDGTITCVGSLTVPATHGIAVVCGQACDTLDCSEALANAAENLTHDSLQYVVRLIAFAAQCPPKPGHGGGGSEGFTF